MKPYLVKSLIETGGRVKLHAILVPADSVFGAFNAMLSLSGNEITKGDGICTVQYVHSAHEMSEHERAVRMANSGHSLENAEEQWQMMYAHVLQTADLVSEMLEEMDDDDGFI